MKRALLVCSTLIASAGLALGAAAQSGKGHEGHEMHEKSAKTDCPMHAKHARHMQGTEHGKHSGKDHAGQADGCKHDAMAGKETCERKSAPPATEGK